LDDGIIASANEYIVFSQRGAREHMTLHFGPAAVVVDVPTTCCSIRINLYAGLLLWAASLPTLAQAPAESSAQPPESPAPVVTEVVVTGERPTVETSIDRKSYSLSNDLQATAGSVADVMRNLPSVTVDLDGNPSLRGDPGVEILIDGRAAPQFNGANRGAALQQLGADNIERIEVITNPPANFKRDGSSGIINIITKRRSGARTADAQASVGSRGRYNVGGSQGGQFGKLNLRGSAGLRHDLRIRDAQAHRVSRDVATGDALASRVQQSSEEEDRLSKSISLEASYDLTDVDRITAEGSYRRRDADAAFEEHNLVLDSANSPNAQFERAQPGTEVDISNSATLRFHHSGENGDGLTVLAQRSEDSERERERNTNSYFVPPQAATVLNTDADGKEVTYEFSADYTKTLAEQRKLITGYELQRDNSLFDNAQTLPVTVDGDLVPDPNFTNVFRYEQMIHALYGSYERPFEQWTLLAGLRLEQTDIDTNQVTSGETGSQSYFRVYPSIHLSDELNEQHTLTFSYGRRVSRPEADDLNPYLVQEDEFTLSRGNPDLLPREIDSLEAGWSYEEDRTSLGATLYARRSRNNFTVVATSIDPNVVLTTLENVGESRSGGLEFTSSGKLAAWLDYNVSGNVYYNEIDARNLGITATRSAVSYEAKLALTWRASDKDTVQLNAVRTGKQLTPQGERRANTTMDLGYRHKFRSNLSFTATLSDVFASRRNRLVLDTPELSESRSTQPAGRIAWIGVSWSLAGAKQQSREGFEYEQAP
jgi:outer membrane receptor protein involved in Fe transport